MDHVNNVNLHVFDEKSTMKNDYRAPTPEFFKQYHIYKWNTNTQEELPEVKPQKSKKKCNESLTKLRDNVYVPFNLLWTPKPIVDSRKLSRKIYVKPADCEKEESIRTRPRVYVAPAVSIDDIADKEKRDLMLSYMYTTEFRNAERDVNTFRSLKKKEKTVCCCSVPNKVKTGEYEYMVQDMENSRVMPAEVTEDIHVSSNMREKYYDEWDKHQNRACVSPTDYFWNHTDVPRNKHVEDGLITPELRKEISELIRLDKLRFPHDISKEGYTGHKVKVAAGVPLQKQDFPPAHPLMSTQQALYCRYKQDMIDSKK